MSSAARVAVEKIPFPFLAFSFVAGLVLMFLSPISLYLPPWVRYPFSNDVFKTSTALLSIAVISFCIGIIMHLVYPFLLGERGLNRWIKVDVLRRRAREPVENEFQLGEIKDFVSWLMESRSASHWDYLLTQYMMVSAFLSASETAIFLCIAAVLGNAIYSLLPGIELVALWPSIGASIRLMIISIFVFGILLLYNRALFQRYFRQASNAMIQEWRACRRREGSHYEED